MVAYHHPYREKPPRRRSLRLCLSASVPVLVGAAILCWVVSLLLAWQSVEIDTEQLGRLRITAYISELEVIGSPQLSHEAAHFKGAPGIQHLAMDVKRLNRQSLFEVSSKICDLDSPQKRDACQGMWWLACSSICMFVGTIVSIILLIFGTCLFVLNSTRICVGPTVSVMLHAFFGFTIFLNVVLHFFYFALGSGFAHIWKENLSVFNDDPAKIGKARLNFTVRNLSGLTIDGGAMFSLAALVLTISASIVTCYFNNVSREIREVEHLLGEDDSTNTKYML